MDRPINAVLGCLISLAASTQALAQNCDCEPDVLSQISMLHEEGPKSDSTSAARRSPPRSLASEVEYQNDNARISAEVQDLPKPGSLGPYTTYVLWAVSPDGRATNHGVIGGVEGGKGAIKTQYNASQFALIVTAEPHFAVTIPSTMMLTTSPTTWKALSRKVTTLTERSDEPTPTVSRSPRRRMRSDRFVQARYAVAIANSAQSDMH
jgi:hypothetical protein